MKKGQTLGRMPRKQTGIRIPMDLYLRMDRVANAQRTNVASVVSREAEVLVRRTRSDRPDLLAWVVLGLFAGLRPAEAGRSTWDAVKERSIVVSAQASKVRQRRVVKPPETALAWLMEARRLGSRLPTPLTSVRRFQKAARTWLGRSEWPQDILRHSAASYWVAQTRDLASVAYSLGNSPDTLRQHYLELIPEGDEVRFWRILPEVVEQEGVVVALRETGKTTLEIEADLQVVTQVLSPHVTPAGASTPGGPHGPR